MTETKSSLGANLEMIIKNPHFRKLFADDLLTFLESFQQKPSKFFSAEKERGVRAKANPDPQPPGPFCHVKHPGERFYRFRTELWPLINDYHRHFKNASVAKEMLRRLHEREIQHQLEKNSWLKRREILIDLIEDTLVKLIISKIIKEDQRIIQERFSENFIHDQQVKKVKLELLHRAQKSPNEFKKILNSFIDQSIHRPNEVPKLQSDTKRKKINLDQQKAIDEWLRFIMTEKTEAQFQHARELLAAFEISARYTYLTTLHNPTAIYLKSPKVGQLDLSVKKVMGIKYEKK